MTWVLTVLSIVGVVLNIKKQRLCFLIWLFTNLSWMVYDWRIGAHAQAVLFGIYAALSAWGLREWRRRRG